jgi:uncharacterized DUF497 family protein
MAEDFNYHFEWDSVKLARNQKKHKINFELAATIFNDPLMLTVPDIDHSGTEERWLSLGQAENSRLLVVIHTYQEINAHEANVRIISARPVTKHEQHQYEASV